MALETEDRLNAYLDWLSRLRSAVSHSRRTGSGNSSVDTTSLEDSLMSWLEEKGFAEAWKLAPILAEANIQLSWLQELELLVRPDALCLVLSDAMGALEREASVLLLSEAADRIFRLVTAVKDCSYMDREPVQDVNITESLDTVLHLFQPRLAGITVRRCYSPEVPLLKALGRGLNQAWAALIENSLDAMGDSGTLTLSSKLQGKTILVEIADTATEFPRSLRIACSSPSLQQNHSVRDWAGARYRATSDPEAFWGHCFRLEANKDYVSCAIASGPR